MDKKAEILFVDDERDFLDSLRIILEGNGYQVRSVSNGHEAKKALEQKVPDLNGYRK